MYYFTSYYSTRTATPLQACVAAGCPAGKLPLLSPAVTGFCTAHGPTQHKQLGRRKGPVLVDRPLVPAIAIVVPIVLVVVKVLSLRHKASGGGQGAVGVKWQWALGAAANSMPRGMDVKTTPKP
jgi:hypothetical protein